jgi:hypothetical protein
VEPQGELLLEPSQVPKGLFAFACMIPGAFRLGARRSWSSNLIDGGGLGLSVRGYARVWVRPEHTDLNFCNRFVSNREQLLCSSSSAACKCH